MPVRSRLVATASICGPKRSRACGGDRQVSQVTTSFRPTQSAFVVSLRVESDSGVHPAIALHAELRVDRFGGLPGDRSGTRTERMCPALRMRDRLRRHSSKEGADYSKHTWRRDGTGVLGDVVSDSVLREWAIAVYADLLRWDP